jgi:hypothetical protein
MGHRDGVGVLKREKSLARAGIRNPGHPARDLVCTLTTSSWFPLFQVPIILKNLEHNLQPATISPATGHLGTGFSWFPCD